MTAKRKLICDKAGMVLFSALLVVSALMVAGMGAWIAIQNDYKITTNLRQATAVFYLADAGIEWAKQQISQTAIHPPRPADQVQRFSFGTFSVVYLSSTPVTPLTAKIVIRSTGASGISSQTVQAQIVKAYDLADGAIGLRASETTVSLSGNSFLVSGFDYDPTSGAPVAGAKPRSAISSSSAALRAQIDAALLPTLKSGNVMGGENNTAVSQSDLIPSPIITRLGEELCRAPHAATTAIPVGGTLSVAGETWGSQAAPQLRCIEGLSGPGDSVTVGGKFSGVGILVVRNAELVADSAFRWEGLIIVTGTGVGFRVVEEENKEVYGAIMINETGSVAATTPTILALQGAIKVFYSRSALDRVISLVPSATLENIYASLPSTITQDYWRNVNP
jgi:Tfp pilus assembly protein PilX